MKSSTIRRSTLSKETMDVIETLSKEQDNENSIGEYFRPDEIEAEKEVEGKSQEIDLLWQTFKTAQFTSNSPVGYVTMGFVAGVIVTLLFMFGISSLSSKSDINSSGKTSIIESIFSRQQKVDEQTLEQQASSAEENEGSDRVSVPTDEDVTNVENNSSTEQVSEGTEKSENFDSSKMKKYVVKSGDTVESIIKKNYGTYSPEKADLIMKANNMKSLDRINIDQELLIPME